MHRSPIRTPLFWVGIAISAICLYFALRQVDWPLFRLSIAGVRPAWLVAGAAFSVAASCVSSLRWQRLARHQLPLSYGDAFDSLMIGNFTNLIIPSRFGDLLRAVLVARRAETRVSRMVASIVVERYADVLMLLGYALALAAVITFPAPVRTALISLAAAAIASLALVYVAADWVGSIVVRVAGWISPRLATRLGGMVEAFSTGLSAAGGPRSLVGTLWLSLLSWTFWGLSAVSTLTAFGLPVPWYAGLFVMVVVNLGALVPASPASIGVYHYLAMLALSIWVQNTGVTLGYAVVSHALSVLITTLLGAWSLGRRGLTLAAAARIGETWPAQANQ